VIDPKRIYDERENRRQFYLKQNPAMEVSFLPCRGHFDSEGAIVSRPQKWSKFARDVWNH
jgi:hypothetical protein